jgi:hypothetical protein
MNIKKTSIVALFAIFGLILISFILLYIFSKPITENTLRRAGFKEVSIESLHMGLSGTDLKNIKLDGNAVSNLKLYATLPDILSARLGKVVVSDVNLSLPLMQKQDETSKPLSNLNFFAREVEFQNISLTLPSAKGDILIVLSGTMIERGDIYNVQGSFTTTAPFLEATGTLKAEIAKSDATVKAHIEISEGKITLPEVEIKRLAGWLEVTVMQDDLLPTLNAQISAGATKIFGIPFQGMTLTASPEQILLNGQVINNGGEVMADIGIDPSKPEADFLKARIQTQLKNLDALKLEKVKGTADLDLTLTAAKEKSAKWQDIQAWKDLNGDMNLSAQNLTLPGAISKGKAAAKVKLAFDPKMRQLALDTEGASFGSDTFSLDKISAHLKAYLSDKPVVEGKLEIGEAKQIGDPLYIVPVRLSLQFQPLSSLQYATGFYGEITEKSGLLYAKIQGKHDAAASKGNLDMNMPPIKLVKGVHSLKEIFPITDKYLSDTSGTIGLSAGFNWQKGKNGWNTSSQGELYLKEFSASAQDNPIENVNTVLKLDSLIPMTLTQQKVSVGLFNAGLPLTEGVVVVSLDAKKNFTLHEAEWTLAKGKISSTPFTVQLDDMTADVTLTASKLDLPELFKIAPMEGLDATGTVNGKLPLKIEHGNISLVDGVLEAEGPGAVRYNPQVVPSFLQNTQKQMIDLRVALKAFEFDSLKMTLSGELGKNQKVGLHIKGKNPEFYDGHPVNLNLNVEGPLQNVLKYNPKSSQIPDSIKKQLEEYEKQHAKH